MGKPSTPAPPDYVGAAEAQAESSAENIAAQTLANRPNQNTPWGSSEWTQGPGGQWTQNLSLAGPQQQSLDNEMRVQNARSDLAYDMTGRLQDEMGDPMKWNKFGDAGGSVTPGEYDSSQRYYDEAGSAIYDKATSRLDPMWEQNMEAAEVRLRNQGLNPGDEAYDRAMEQANFAKTDAYGQASYDATMGAGQEAARMAGMDRAAGGQTFGEGMAASQYDTQLRQQEIVEEMQRRGMSLNEINAAMSGQQVAMPTMPGFNTAGASQPTNYLDAANMGWGADMDQFGAEQAGMNSFLSGLGGLGSMAMSY